MQSKQGTKGSNRTSLHIFGLLILIGLVAACGETAPAGPTLGVPTITSVTAECNSDQQLVRVITWAAAEGANGYRLLLNGEQLTEAKAGTTTVADTTPAEPGQVLTYVVRAVNAAGTKDSAAHEFTVPESECGDPTDNPEEPENPDDPDDPENPEDPEDPEDPADEPPGPFDYLTLELRCTPFGELHAEWGAVNGATSYALLQEGEVVHEVEELAGEEGSALVQPIPGRPFEFTLQARNAAGTLDGPVTAPTRSTCHQDNVQLAAGNRGVLMVDETGAVWGWGNNADHALGMGTEALPTPATSTSGPTNVRKLQLRNSVGLALGWDGAVQVWGTSAEGLVGRAGATTIETAEAIPGLTGIVDVALGESHALAVDNAGRVWVWGTFLDRRIEVPELVPVAEGVIAVAAGANTAFGLLANGTVMAWGRNGSADVLGHGAAADFPEPTLVEGVEGAVELYAAHTTLYFRRADGSIASLGRSYIRGAATIGVTEWPALHGLRDLSVGSSFVLAVTAEREVMGWGFNWGGQLGRTPRETDTYDPPELIGGLPAVKAVFAGTEFSVAVDVTGQVHAWGSNIAHQLGLDAIDRVDAFTPVGLPEEATAVESGSGAVFAIGASGAVYSWGDNLYGVLGRDASRSLDWQPVAIEELSDIVQVAVGQNFVLALNGSGSVYSWGFALYGRLGDGDPAFEVRPTPTLIDGLTDVVKVAAGNNHAVALDSDGRVWTWGSGGYGALGLGDEEDRSVPTLVDLGTTVVNDIAAGSAFTLLVANEFAIVGFGRNDRWQLSDEQATEERELLPVAVGFSLGGISSVYAGIDTGFTVHSLGTLFAWGGNSGRIKGCCGDGVAEPDIVQVPSVSNIAMVAAYQGHALYLDGAAGVAYGAGHNVSGQLGLPESNAYAGPQQVPLSGSVTHVSTGHNYSALVMDGVVHVTGRNTHGTQNRAPLHVIPFPVLVNAPPVAGG